MKVIIQFIVLAVVCLLSVTSATTECKLECSLSSFYCLYSSNIIDASAKGKCESKLKTCIDNCGKEDKFLQCKKDCDAKVTSCANLLTSQLNAECKVFNADKCYANCKTKFNSK